MRLRPCMTASGPEDIGASWVDRQFLKSAHWTRESPLSAIRVLRETECNSWCLYWKSFSQCRRWMSSQFNHMFIVELINTILNGIRLIISIISSSYFSDVFLGRTASPLFSFSPCLQWQAEAVRLPIGQSNDWNSLLSQQRLRHCDVSSYRHKQNTFRENRTADSQDSLINQSICGLNPTSHKISQPSMKVFLRIIMC